MTVMYSVFRVLIRCVKLIKKTNIYTWIYECDFILQGVWWGNRRERDHLGDPGIDGGKILSWIFRKWVVGIMDWIKLPQDSDRWRVLLNAVMNLRVP